MAFVPVESYYDEHKKIWSGKEKVPLYNPKCSVGEVIYWNLKTYPTNVLQISDTEGTMLTSSATLTSAIRIAQHFKKMELKTDDVIGIVGLNTTYVMPLVLACFFNCTPFHSMNPIYDNNSMTKIAEITKPKVIFCDAQFYDKVKLVTQSFQPIIHTLFGHIEGVPSLLDMLEPTNTELLYRPQRLTLGPEQTIAIICSSGTTGLPKAVSITNSRMNVGVDFLNSKDVLFSPSGVDWITGLIFIFLSCLLGSTRIISNKPFSVEYYVEIIKKHKVTTVFMPPRHVSALVKCPTATIESMSSLVNIMVGGGCIASTTLRALKDMTKNAHVIFNFAITEFGPMTRNYDEKKVTSAGKLLPGVRMRVVDESGRNLGPMEVGELYVVYKHAWSGYYNDPKATQASQDTEGWFRTGDLGYFDADHFLYIVDRKKNVLKYNGLQFWTSEIENCIMAMPQVKDVCVFGIYDESCGDKAAALIIKCDNSDLSEQDVKDYVTKLLISEHKQLNAGVLFVDKLPSNSNGKTLTDDAKKIFLAHFDSIQKQP